MEVLNEHVLGEGGGILILTWGVGGGKRGGGVK